MSINSRKDLALGCHGRTSRAIYQPPTDVLPSGSVIEVAIKMDCCGCLSGPFCSGVSGNPFSFQSNEHWSAQLRRWQYHGPCSGFKPLVKGIGDFLQAPSPRAPSIRLLRTLTLVPIFWIFKDFLKLVEIVFSMFVSVSHGRAGCRHPRR